MGMPPCECPLCIATASVPLRLSLATNWRDFRLVNDVTIKPLESSKQTIAEPNVAFWEVVYLGWPYLLIGALRDIGVGEELCALYGNEYWKGMRQILRREARNKRVIVPMIRSLTSIASELAAHGQQMSDSTLKVMTEFESWDCDEGQRIAAPGAAEGVLSASRPSVQTMKTRRTGTVETQEDPVRIVKDFIRKIKNLREMEDCDRVVEKLVSLPQLDMSTRNAINNFARKNMKNNDGRYQRHIEFLVSMFPELQPGVDNTAQCKNTTKSGAGDAYARLPSRSANASSSALTPKQAGAHLVARMLKPGADDTDGRPLGVKLFGGSPSSNTSTGDKQESPLSSVHNRERHSLASNDDLCAICTRPMCTPAFWVYCASASCRYSAHRSCVGLQHVRAGPWLCARCTVTSTDGTFDDGSEARQKPTCVAVHQHGRSRSDPETEALDVDSASMAGSVEADMAHNGDDLRRGASEDASMLRSWDGKLRRLVEPSAERYVTSVGELQGAAHADDHSHRAAGSGGPVGTDSSSSEHDIVHLDDDRLHGEVDDSDQEERDHGVELPIETGARKVPDVIVISDSDSDCESASLTPI